MTIKLTDVAKYYEGKPHQKRALEFLQRNTPHAVLDDFAALWRKPTEPHDLIINRLNALGISLDKHPKGKTGFTTTIIGIEGVNKDYSLNNDEPDKFNDIVIAACMNGKGVIKFSPSIVVTTEPGRHYTQNRLNSRGAARVAIEMKHPHIWKRGKHKNQPNCLIQIGGPIMVTRDGNADGARTGDYVESGYFGINFHTVASKISKNGSIGRWSAGCTVCPDPKIFYQFINAYIKPASNSSFSYILLDGSKIF